MNKEKKREANLAQNRRKKEKSAASHKRKLFTANDPRSIISEQYRMLKTSIDFSSVDKKLRTIMVTSSNTAEGKSTTIANIAILYAQQGKRVLLIDADLRKPTVHNTFSLPNTKGLSNVLTGAVPLTEAVHVTDVEKLCVLTSGPIPPNPTDLLGSNAMDKLIDKLVGIFDMVVFDAPPILPVTDPLVLSRKCDGVVLVVRSGSTKKEDLKKAKEGLEKAQANVLGAVLTGCDNKEKQYYYYG